MCDIPSTRERNAVSRNEKSPTMALRFLHAADIHLGRPFSGLTRSSPALGKLFRESGYIAWDRMVEAAVDRRVDFVTLAGDIFDRSDPTVRSRVIFREGLARLHDAGIPVYMTLGNHDPLTGFPQALKTLPSLHVFGADPEGVEVEPVENTSGIVVFGASFPNAAVAENLVLKFRRDPGIDLAIGVVHANVQGDWGHKNYAPCTADDLKTSGMDVWCLGHVHSAVVLSEDPLIFYPGTVQGAHIHESGPRGCSIVTVCRDGAQLETVHLAPVRWETIDLDVRDITDAEHLIYLAEDACSRFSAGHGVLEAVVVRFNLTGRSSVHGLWSAGDYSDFLDALEERLASLPVPVFPESVRDFTQVPVNLEALMSEDGFLSDYLKLCHESAMNSAVRSELLTGARARVAKHVGRRFLDGNLDSDRLKIDPEATGRLLSRCASLVAQMFLERSG